MGPKLISNAYRTSSMSIPSVEREALGGQHRLGYRTCIVESDDAEKDSISAFSTGYEVGGYGRDPLEILISEEEVAIR